MAGTVIGTHRIVKRLRSAGFSDAQAETVSDILRESWESGRAEQATRSDLTVVRKEPAEMEARRAKWFVALRLGQAALIVAPLRLLP